MNTTTARIVAGAACLPLGLAESVMSSGLSGYGGALGYASLGMGVAGSVHLVGGLALMAMGAVMAAKGLLGASGGGTYEATTEPAYNRARR
jgi:hypothetical protein